MAKEIGIKGHKRIPDAIDATPDENYTRFDNDILRSPEYSAVEVKLLGIFCSNRDGWISWMSQVQTMMKEGEKSIKKAMKELERKGHVKRCRYKDKETGKYIGSFLSYSMNKGQHKNKNLENNIKILMDAGYIVTDKVGTKITGIHKDPKPEGGKGPGGKPPGGKEGIKNTNGKNINKGKEQYDTVGQEKISKNQDENSSMEEQYGTVDTVDITGQREEREEERRIEKESVSCKEKESLADIARNLSTSMNNGQQFKKLVKCIPGLDFSISESDRVFHVGDVGLFQDKGARHGVKYETGEIPAAREVYQAMPDCWLKDLITKYVGHESKKWDFKRTKDKGIVRDMFVLEFLLASPNAKHFLVCYKEGRLEEDINSYPARNNIGVKKKKEQVTGPNLLETWRNS